MSFIRWRHFITARGSNCGYPRAVLSLEQGLIILFKVYKRVPTPSTGPFNVGEWSPTNRPG